jgi:hypothetical protein
VRKAFASGSDVLYGTPHNGKPNVIGGDEDQYRRIENTLAAKSIQLCEDTHLQPSAGWLKAYIRLRRFSRAKGKTFVW